MQERQGAIRSLHTATHRLAFTIAERLAETENMACSSTEGRVGSLMSVEKDLEAMLDMVRTAQSLNRIQF